MSAKHLITFTFEVSDEDLRAGNYAFAPHRPDEKMDDEDIVMFHLKPAVQFNLHVLRSKMKWDEMKIYASPNLRKEEVFQGPDAQPTGRYYPVQVRTPVEGSWECPSSPTRTCWYADQEDPCWDGCLFCSEPNERK